MPALVLAGGASRRFGRSKALARWREGTLIERAIHQARQLSSEVRVVTGCRGNIIRYRSRGVPTVWLQNTHWQKGMSTSLNCGLHSLPTLCKGVFVVLVDQPLVPGRDLRNFASLAREQPLLPLAADYGNRPGVPAYLPRWLWPAIAELEGDQGAGVVLRQINARRIPIAGVEDDIDTPQDLRFVSLR
jgi:CTP:molybdopterin cytidylyltransferase MocA